jgi:hypothetical protein
MRSYFDWFTSLTHTCTLKNHTWNLKNRYRTWKRNLKLENKNLKLEPCLRNEKKKIQKESNWTWPTYNHDLYALNVMKLDIPSHHYLWSLT